MLLPGLAFELTQKAKNPYEDTACDVVIIIIFTCYHYHCFWVLQKMQSLQSKLSGTRLHRQHAHFMSNGSTHCLRSSPHMHACPTPPSDRQRPVLSGAGKGFGPAPAKPVSQQKTSPAGTEPNVEPCPCASQKSYKVSETNAHEAGHCERTPSRFTWARPCLHACMLARPLLL